MRGSRPLSRASPATRASTAMGTRAMMDVYDSKIGGPPKIAANLLYPEARNDEYESLMRVVANRRKARPCDIAARKIQQIWRGYRSRQRHIGAVFAFSVRRAAVTKRYFYIMLLNSHIHSKDRNEYLKVVAKSSIASTKLFRGYVVTTPEVYANTGMIAMPGEIDQQKIVKMTRMCFAPKLLEILNAWRLSSRRAKSLGAAKRSFKFDEMAQKMFKHEFVCFEMWRRYSRSKRKVSVMHMPMSAEVPHWNYFQSVMDSVKRVQAKADAIRVKNLQENAVQALKIGVQNARHTMSLKVAEVTYTVRRRMKFALNAWMKCIVLQQSEIVMRRYVFRRWLQCLQRRKHTEMLKRALDARHDYWKKRMIMHIFYRNWKVQPVLSTFSYLKIHQKPSLALYFIALLRGDEGQIAITHALELWIAYVRRKRRWHHFVFKNEETTNYTPIKQLAFAGLSRRNPPTLAPLCLYSGRFKRDSMMAYSDVMQDHIDTRNIFLLISGNPPDGMKAPRNKMEQRKNFFMTWKSEPVDISLFLRVVIIYCAKQKAQATRNAQMVSESCFLQYKKAMAFLAEMNLASDAKFQSVRSTINTNNRRSLGNRCRCIHRDNLLMLAHESHSDAVDLHDARPNFKAESGTKLFERTHRATEELIKAFEPLVPLTALGPILERPNENKFLRVYGCRSAVESFKRTIKEAHTQIQSDLIRSEVGHDAVSNFDRFLSSKEHGGQGHGGTRTHTRTDAYRRNKRHDPPSLRPISGISRKLLGKFPVPARKPRIRGNKGEKVIVRDIVEATEEPVPLEEQPTLSTETLPIVAASDSSYFSGMSSFTNLLSSASKAVFNADAQRSEDLLAVLVEDANDVPDKIESGRRPTNDIPVIEEETKEVAKTTKQRSVESDNALVEGFDKNTMMSLRMADDVSSPRTLQKYRMFLELLFGAGSRDRMTSYAQRLRRKILDEYKFRKASLSSCGVVTGDFVRPVTNIMEKFRSEKERVEEDEDIAIVTRVKERGPLIAPNILGEEKETTYVYNSRRFNKFAKVRKSRTRTPKKDANGDVISDSGNEGDDEAYYSSYESDSSFRDDLLQGSVHIEAVDDDDDDDVDDGVTDIPDTDFDAAAAIAAAHAAEEEEMERLQAASRDGFVFDPSTPYAANRKGRGLLSHVNKIAFHILKKGVNDEGGGLNSLVEVDSDGMPSLELGGLGNDDGKSKRHPLGRGSGPKYRQCHAHKANITRRRQMFPIVMQDHREMSKEMRTAVQEQSAFPQVSYNNGRTIFTRSHAKPAYEPYVPAWRMAPTETDNGGIHFPDQTQVVSFSSGTRQSGTDMPNYGPLRVSSVKQRAITKPMHGGRKSELLSRPTTQLSHARPCGDRRLKNVITELISMMAANEDSEGFSTFRLHAKALRRRPGYANAGQTQLEGTQLYSQIQSIFMQYTSMQNLRETSSHLIKVAKDNAPFASALSNAIDGSLRERTYRSLADAKREVVDRSAFNPDLASQYVDISWMTEADLGYKAIAVHYNEVVKDDPALDAVISSTEPSRCSSPARPRSKATGRRQDWDDVIKDYDISEMMLVTPCIVPESEIDKFLEKRRPTPA